MPDDDFFGDSDDDALLLAATQHADSQAGEQFEPSPRPAKRRRVDASADPIGVSTDELDADLLDDGDGPQNGDAELVEDPDANKKKRLFHAPRVQANLERVILTQTQMVPQSQPWEIRGPIWRRPKPSEVTKPNTIASYFDRRIAPDDPASKEVREAATNAIIQTKKTNPASIVINEDDYNVNQDLLNLPSDAFSSSAPSPVMVDPGPRLVAPQQGLRQTTLFGRQGAEIAPSQVNKRHNWPLANKDEPPTHHQLDLEAMKTWVYPTNIGKIRDYQFNIVHRGLYHNLLVALPTGLGKTFIAATVILNFYRWTKNAQIIFVAPTKPLVAQQVEACFNIAGIRRSDTTMLTGEVQAGLRAEEWEKKRVFFMTPQTLINDLKTGICDPKRIVLVVIDEAHRATGGYAYVEVVKFIRRFNESFRVLALTATPGGDVEAVQKVIDGLDISRCEIRTEQSLDIREYVHAKEITKQVFEPNEEMELLYEWFSKATQPILDVVTGQNAYYIRDPLRISRFGLLSAQKEYAKSNAGRHANQAVKGMLASAFSVLQSLAFALEFLRFYSIRAFYDQLKKMRQEAKSKKSKYRKQLDESEAMEKMMVRLEAWHSDPDFVSHPKLEQVRAEVLQHLIDAGEGANGGERTSTRIEIFSQYRESVEEICRVLKRDAPIVRPHVFVGQSSSEKSEGMSQKKQLEVTSKFKSGEYNVLIATQVGEEGLDIGELDLIICYDSKSSPIRLLQRMGRTGRKREGRVVWLQMKGKEQDDAMKAMDNYEKMQELIASGDSFEFHHDRSRRIVPKEIQPVVDKRVVEIPIENTQRTPSDFLPMPSKKGRGRPKRPPKKFHMPDGVETGFTILSKLNATVVPVGDSETVPTVQEVALNEQQVIQLESCYQSLTGDDEEIVIAPPRLSQHPAMQRKARRIGVIAHGSRTTAFVNAMSTIAEMRGKVDIREARSHGEPFSDSEDLESVLVEDKYRKPPSKAAKSKAAREPAPRRGRPPGQKNNSKTTGRAGGEREENNKRRRVERDSSDMEGDPSSAPNTSPNMRMRSQAITLGSADTSGSEDVEGYVDSDLEDFVVNDDQPLSQVDSSLPSPSKLLNRKAAHTRLTVIGSSQDLPELGTLLTSTGAANRGCGVKASVVPKTIPMEKENRNKMNKRRRVVSDDEDDG